MPATQTVARRPNIVLILSDDLGQECLGCYGGRSYETPVLDRLAAGGMRFSQGHAQPLCTPTRVQLMTGKYNFRNWRAFGVMDPAERTFGHLMRSAGYKTCISGKWQLYSYNPPDFEPEWRGKGQHPRDAGFDEYFLWHAEHTEDKGSRYADPKILDNGAFREGTEGLYGPDLFVDYINGFMERHRSEPFFVYYPMTLPHGPHQPTPDSEDWERDRHTSGSKYFKDMVDYHDKLIGRIVDKLEELGLREQTLVIYLGDNGSPREIESAVDGRVMSGGKGHNTDAGTHVPMIASQPGTVPAGRVCDDLIDTSDFVPTILGAAGVPLPGDHVCDGRSFLPQLRGEPGDPREWVFFHHDPLPGHGKVGRYRQRFVRDHRWALFEDGRMFDLEVDLDQRHPLLPGKEGEQAAAARRRLQGVFYEMRVEAERTGP